MTTKDREGTTKKRKPCREIASRKIWEKSQRKVISEGRKEQRRKA